MQIAYRNKKNPLLMELVHLKMVMEDKKSETIREYFKIAQRFSFNF